MGQPAFFIRIYNMASSPAKQKQSQAERDQIKLGQEQTTEARAKSAPLQQDFQKKMNRDDSGRMAGMASADVMQAAGTDRTGQLLAAGQGGGHGSTGLGGQLQQATGNAGLAALARQDSLKSGYNDLGGKKNMNAVAGINASASAASRIASAEAGAKNETQNAMMQGLGGVVGAYGLKQYDKFDLADRALKKDMATPGVGPAGRYTKSNYAALKKKRDAIPGAGAFKWFGDY
jgi:hypothetical protein